MFKNLLQESSGGLLVLFLVFVLSAGFIEGAQGRSGEAEGPAGGSEQSAAALEVGSGGRESMSELSFRQAVSSLGDDLWDLPAEGWDDAKSIISNADYMGPLLMAAGASIAMRSSGADHRIADHFERDKHIVHNKFADEFIYQAGGPGMHFAAAGIWYVSSAMSGDQFNQDRSFALIKALAINGAATGGLKLIVNDDTPNGKDLAWPSGHTSSSFTVAAVLDEFYGPAVGIPAYAGASLVGYRMMEAGDHWGSDVLFGAVMGYIIGHHVAGEHKQLEVAGYRLEPLNYVDDSRAVMGLALRKEF